MLESMMVAERSEFLSERQGNKGNGYRLGHTYGHDRRLEFRYVALAVTGEGKREVLGVLYMPEESATGWGGISRKLKERGVRKIGLMAADLRDIFRTGQPNYTIDDMG